MELGLLVTGGSLASRIDAHFTRMIEEGTLLTCNVLDYRLGPRYRYPNARASGGGREFELRELTSTAAGPGYGGNGSGSGAQRSAANQSSGV